MTDVASRETAPRRILFVSLLSALVVGLASLVAEVGIYAQLIVPRFGSVTRVPVYAWVAMYLPVLIACVFVASKLRSARDVVTAAGAAGLVAQLEKWALAIVGLPSHAKSLALEDPARFWTIHFARMTFGFLVLFALVVAARARLLSPRT